MAFPVNGVVDNFNRTDEGPPMTGWTDIVNGLRVLSNACTTSATGINFSHWSTILSQADCETFLTITVLPTNLRSVAVFGRLTDIGASTTDGYGLRYTTLATSTLDIVRMDNGTETVISTINQTLSAGDKIGLEIVGTTLTAYIDTGSGWTSVDSTTDSTYSSAGYIGAGISGNGTFDDFGGGGLSSGVTGTLTETLDNFTLTGAGTVTIEGTLNVTLANFTLTGAGSVEMRGALNATLDNIALDGVGDTGIVDGSLDVILDNFTLTGAGSVEMRGALDSTLANFTLSGAGTVPRSGALTETLDNFTLSAAGTATGAARLGILVTSRARPFTPTILVTTPSWITNSQFTNDELAYRMDSYSHTITADMGYDSASLRATLRVKEARRWFERGLARNFAFYSPQGLKRWEGFINRITVSMGSLAYSIGPVMNIDNDVFVIFSTTTYNTNPPIGGMQTRTASATDTNSQARYGIFEAILNGGTGLLANMTQIRDVYLADRSEPFRDADASFNRDGTAQISLEMLGYAHLLKKYTYNNTGTGYQNASAKLLAVLAADPSSRFSSSTTFVTTNTYQVAVNETGSPKAWDVVQDVVALGDGSGGRMLFGIYNDRKLHYEAVPTSVSRQMLLSDTSQRLESVRSSIVYPWNVVPGVWAVVSDFLIGQQRVASLRQDVRNILIETVKYTSPFGLSINGQKVDTLPYVMARYGVGGL